ncbi:hypothetical protein GQ53DRAFT_848128 [Thozetella sp. PMI_491]|nr:hypothetical protein GQ53DRAFT_848128 [Thozetella sp. PMI_491]
MSGSQPPIVLYHYSYSPYAKRLVWYLQLRGIPFSQCMQPPILPRPDVARLGLAYRRIPIMSIGRDVYLDTRLMIQKLEELYLSLPRLSAAPASNPEHALLERLLEAFVVDGGVFTSAGQLLPTSLPLLQDPKFLRDRADFSGVKQTREQAEALRPEALAEVRRAMALLETTVLADGRDWLLGTAGPSLADIEAVWPLHWMATMPGALPPDQGKQFPLVYAWIERFAKATDAAKKARGKTPTVSGEEAEAIILAAPYNEVERGVDAGEPLAQFYGLQKGQTVQVWPTDTGTAHKDTGDLVSLSSSEVVIETKTGTGGAVRVHAPRHGFRVTPVRESTSHL